MSGTVPVKFTAAQSEELQQQVTLFKQLTHRHKTNGLAKAAEAERLRRDNILAAQTNGNRLSDTPRVPPMTSMIHGQTITFTPIVSSNQEPLNIAITQNMTHVDVSTLDKQVPHSMVTHAGPHNLNSQEENESHSLISSYSDAVGPITTKSTASQNLPLTVPQAAHFRESLLKRIGMSKEFKRQRVERADLVRSLKAEIDLLDHVTTTAADVEKERKAEKEASVSSPGDAQLVMKVEEKKSKAKKKVSKEEKLDPDGNHYYAIQHPVNVSLFNHTPLEDAHFYLRKNCLRIKKQSIREKRAWERDDKIATTTAQTRKRYRHQDFLKNLLIHREKFLDYHAERRGEHKRLSAALKVYVENLEEQKGKEASAQEALRLEALKDKDMDAYANMLSETKDARIKYLLNETDSCVSTINKLISKQKDSGINTSKESNVGNAVQEGFAADAQGIAQPNMLRGGDLKEYQLAGLKWLVSLYDNNLNGILADDMGLGKTIQTIALLAYLMEVKRNQGPFLVVVPLSTLSNWVNECERWAPSIVKIVYKGAPLVRKQIFKDHIETNQFNLVLTTYEYIMKDRAMLKKLEWQYIIVDEGHRMKNVQSKFAQTLGTVYQSRNRLLLTGTPLQNNLPELWALLNFLLPTVFNSVDSFDQWFNKPFAAFKNQTENDPDDEESVLSQEERMLIVHRLHEVMRPFMLRRVKDQVLDQLPDKVEKIIRCELSGWQKKLYKAIYSRSVSGLKESAVKDGNFDSTGLNNPIMHLRKVCNHPYLFLSEWMSDEDMIRCSGKFELLDRILPKLKAAGHRILLFTQMTQLMTILERFFDMRGFMHLRLDGATSAEEREKRMYTFNDPDSPYFIFALSTRAGGLGLNLATADTVIIFDSDWNPMMDAQAQDRAHRIGQKNEVRVFRLITANSIEDKILARATDKRNLNGLVVEAGLVNTQDSSGSGNTEAGSNKQMMESLLKEWSEGGNLDADVDTEAEEADIHDDDAINEMMAIHRDELELYQVMDRERAIARENKWKLYQQRLGKKPSQMAPLPGPLMGDGEYPPWLSADNWHQRSSGFVQAMLRAGVGGEGELNEDTSVVKIIEAGEYGRSGNSEGVSVSIGGKVMRGRKDVKYDDGLTDVQFQKMLEGQIDVDSDQDEEEEEEQDEDFGSKGKKKSKRGKKGGAAKKRKSNSGIGQKLPSSNSVALDGDMTTHTPTPTFTGGEQRIQLFKALVKIIVDLLKLKGSGGYPLCEWFKDVPNRKVFPDYLTVIAPHQPIALKEMLAKLRAHGYVSIEEFENDFALMSHNARLYNYEDSEVYRAAEEVRRRFYDKLNAVMREYGFVEREMPKLPPIEQNIYSVYTAEQLAEGAKVFEGVQADEDEG